MENLELNFLWKYHQQIEKLYPRHLRVREGDVWSGQLDCMTKKSSDDKDVDVEDELNNFLVKF